MGHQVLRLDEAADLFPAALPALREVRFGEESIVWYNLGGWRFRLLLAEINHVLRSGFEWAEMASRAAIRAINRASLSNAAWRARAIRGSADARVGSIGAACSGR